MPRTDDPVELNSDDPGKNDKLKAATSIQSSVTPEAYSKAHREMQAAVTGDPDATADAAPPKPKSN